MKSLLKTMGMARSTYYFEINRTDAVAKRNEELSSTIKEVFAQNKGRYGVRNTANLKVTKNAENKFTNIGKFISA